MSASCVPMFKNAYLAKLKDDLKTGRTISVYKKSDEYPLDVDGLFAFTHLSLEGELPVLTTGAAVNRLQRAATDIDNAISLHSGLPSLDRSMASDVRLWAYLAHATYFQYCRARFPFGPGDAVQHVLSHWFFGGRSGARRNAIGRLWWAADMTYKPWAFDDALAVYESDDDYCFTRKLLANQDIYQGLFERLFGRSLRVGIVAIEVLSRYKGRVKSFTKFVTEVIKNVNIMAKHTDLEMLSPKELEDCLGLLCERTLSRLNG